MPSDIESNNDSIDVINSNTTEVISSGEKQYKRPGAQPMISNYLVNVDAGQHPLATSSNAKVSVACADVHASTLSSGPCSTKSAPTHNAVVVVDPDAAVPESRKSPVEITSVVSENIEQLPCYSGGFSAAILRDSQDTQFTTLMEMFPQLDEVMIHEALLQANFDIEIAVARILVCSS